jgi:sugar-specific transcriptional regulator TrmB
MKNVENLLKTLGFKKNDIAVYTYILEKGPVSVSEVSRSLKIQRPLVYKALYTLIEKELCAIELQSGRKLYTISDPDHLTAIVKNINTNLEKVLPNIKSIYSKPKTGPSVKLLKGPAGITQTFTDSIKSSNRGDTFCRYTSEKDLDKVNQYLPKRYREMRDAKKLERLVISNYASGTKKRPRLERFIKFIPKEFDRFEQNIIQLIYSNKVAFIDLNTETSLIVENKALADFQKVIFKLLYKKL